MPSSATEQGKPALEFSPEAEAVLRRIIELSGKSAGDVLAEGLALAQLYEQTRKERGRLLIEVGGKTQEISVP